MEVREGSLEEGMTKLSSEGQVRKEQLSRWVEWLMHTPWGRKGKCACKEQKKRGMHDVRRGLQRVLHTGHFKNLVFIHTAMETAAVF